MRNFRAVPFTDKVGSELNDGEIDEMLEKDFKLEPNDFFNTTEREGTLAKVIDLKDRVGKAELRFLQSLEDPWCFLKPMPYLDKIDDRLRIDLEACGGKASEWHIVFTPDDTRADLRGKVSKYEDENETSTAVYEINIDIELPY